VVRPQLLVADEPVSMLDVSVSSGIVKLLLRLKEEYGVAFIFIGHDLAVARYVSDRLAVMYLGRIVEQGPTDQIIAQPAHPYTKLLITAVPDFASSRKRPRVQLPAEPAKPIDVAVGCRFRARCPLAQPICATDDPPLLAIGVDRAAACHFWEEVITLDRLPLT
jgi:oligopeptide/dipeptide ABC transporter ATP-binding protein